MLSLPPILVVFYLFCIAVMCCLIAERRYVTVVVSSLPALLISMMIGPAIFVMGMGVVLISLVAAAIKMKWYAFGGLAIVLLAFANVMHRRDVEPAVAEVDQLRAEFPVRSLKDRLAFHQQHPVEGGEEAARTYLAKAGNHTDGWRSYALKRLHEEGYRDFVASAGFGISRMPRVHRNSIELPVLARTPVASKDICFDNRDVPDRLKPPMPDLVGMHRDGLKDFLNTERMGFSRGVDYVIGFEPHAMATAPKSIPVEHETWQIARLELVSLLKHDTPVVYVSDELPNLDELDDVPTRPLDDFETEQLPKLKDGEYLLTSEGPSVIRMLGAVRASESCLACHSVPMQTLLGAFSYEVRPLQNHPESTTDKPLASR